MQAHQKIFSENDTAAACKTLLKSLEAVIDAYLKLHPKMHKNENKVSDNLSNLINMHARALDYLNKPPQDICAIEKYTFFINLIESEIKVAIDKFGNKTKQKSLSEDSVNLGFVTLLNEKQNYHHRSRLLCILLAKIYAQIDIGDLPQTSHARVSKNKILRVEDVQTPKADAYMIFKEHLSDPTGPTGTEMPNEDHDELAQQTESLIMLILTRIKHANEIYQLLHRDQRKTSHGDDFLHLVKQVEHEVMRTINTLAVHTSSKRHQTALIRLSNILTTIQTSLLNVCKTKMKSNTKRFTSNNHVDINSIIHNLNTHPNKSHYTRMLCLILKDTYEQLDTHLNIGLNSLLITEPHPAISDKDLADLELLKTLITGVKPQTIQTVLGYHYSKIFNEYKLDTSYSVTPPLAFNKNE